MAKTEQIDFVFDFIMRTQPQETYKLMTDSSSGICAVLRILAQAKTAVTAGDISGEMGVSEARVTVLLKKMKKRGYITKERDKTDARVTIVKLTREGQTKADDLKKALKENIATVIDCIGIEKITQFITISEEIESVIKTRLEPPPVVD
ncbi:MAG: MarR family winged helix-turn-helix transcriptional regulator [Candidatus Coproplasma sp.]